MVPRVSITHPAAPARVSVIGTSRPAGSRAAADLIERASRQVLPALLDADIDGPAPLGVPRRPIAVRVLGILGPIGLATCLGAGYALRLFTGVSPLEDRATLVPAGFFAFFLIAVWPTFGDEGHGPDQRSPVPRRRAAALRPDDRGR